MIKTMGRGKATMYKIMTTRGRERATMYYKMGATTEREGGGGG